MTRPEHGHLGCGCAAARVPIAYSLDGAADAVGKSRAYLQREIGAGRLKAKKSSVDADGNPVGTWTILHSALEAWAEALPDA